MDAMYLTSRAFLILARPVKCYLKIASFLLPYYCIWYQPPLRLKDVASPA